MSRKQLLVIITLMTVMPFALSAKKKAPKPDENPIFTNVEYYGQDSIYINNPLGEDEFYNPILQGCYPDPSIYAEKAMTIISYAHLL